MVALFHGERLLDRNVEADSRNLAADWLEENADSEAVVLLPNDLWLDPTTLAGLRTADVEPGGANLAAGLAAEEASVRYLLVPSYEAPHEPRGRNRTTETIRQWIAAPQRLVEIEERWRRAVERPGASKVLDLPGRPIRLALNPRRVARPVRNPDFAIYRIPAGR
jgi:hypothetical protein